MNSRGSAIIIVLIISTVSILLTVFIVKASKVTTTSSELLFNRLRAEFGALSEMEKIEFYASTGRFGPFYIDNNVAGLPKRLFIDGRTQKIGNCTVSIQGTGGLINVWYLNIETLHNLLLLDNLSRPKINIIINSLKDWYDRNNFPRVGGAEAEYYKQNGFTYTPRNFEGVQSICEWRDIRGLTDYYIFDKIKKYLTLSPRWHPNMNTMGINVLSAFLNIPKQLAQSLITYKNSNGYITNYDLKRLLEIDLGLLGIYDSDPTFALDIKIEFKFNDAVDRLFAEISFIPTDKKPFTVIKWIN